MKTLLLIITGVLLALPAHAQSDLYVNSTNGFVGIGTTVPDAALDLSQNTGALSLPIGTTGQEPASPVVGMIRYNNTSQGFEGYGGSTPAWGLLGGGSGSGTVGSGAAGQAAYYQSTGTTVIGTSSLNISNGEVGIATTSPASALDVYGTISNNGKSINTNNIPAFDSGFVNKLRNGNMLVSQRMAANTSTTLSTSADAYWIDGWIYHITGANVTGYWQNSSFTATSGSNPAYIPAYAEIKGAASNTAIDIYQRIENTDASALAGGTATVQFQFYNDSGASITPTFQTCYASTVNNFSTCTADVSATNMQACANNTTCTEAYTFSVSSNATNGYQIQFNFGAMTSSSDIIEFTGFDLRATPGIATGLNSSPPIIEQPNFSAELARDQRYFISSVANGVNPSGAAGNTYGYIAVAYSSFGAATGFRFPVQMRATPTVTGYSFTNGTAGDWTCASVDDAVTFGVISAWGVSYIILSGGQTGLGDTYAGNYSASAEL
jgi:hypothetical protein